MRYFREIEPDIYTAAGALQTEADGHGWVGEYDTLLARGQPFAVIVDARDRPQPPAGKPMVLWMKARKAELGRLVRLTAYVVEDAAERADLERALPARSKSSPYPMAVAANPAEALTKARSSLGRP
ncbi:MAG: hypothetical protein ACTHNH_00100 [Mesorhizobium sp.]